MDNYIPGRIDPEVDRLVKEFEADRLKICDKMLNSSFIKKLLPLLLAENPGSKLFVEDNWSTHISIGDYKNKKKCVDFKLRFQEVEYAKRMLKKEEKIIYPTNLQILQWMADNRFVFVMKQGIVHVGSEE